MLIDDIKEWYTEESYPPDASSVNAKIVYDEYVAKLRWGQQFIKVYQRGDEYVAIRDVEPATEMQDWGDYGKPDIYLVEPYEVTTTEYMALDKSN